MQAILDFFRTVFNLIGSFISSSIWALQNIPKMAVSFSAVFAYAPQFLQSLVIDGGAFYAGSFCYSYRYGFSAL